MKEVDCLIIGQGIAGTLLSFALLQAGLSVQVIDQQDPRGASKVASGVINPVTGRRVVETWKIDQLLPLAVGTYNQISDFLGVASVVRSVEILAIHNSEQMQQAYEKRIGENSRYIGAAALAWCRPFFKQSYGMHQIYPALLIDLQTLLSAYRNYLLQADLLTDSAFDWSRVQIPGQGGLPVIYEQGPLRLQAKWVIAAEGAAVAKNPYFRELAFRYNKGEALIIAAPELPRDYIYKLRYSIVPWGEEGLFWVGSTYQWAFDDALPTASFKESVIRFLDGELLVPYQVVDHLAAVRPASVNRRPFAGFHRKYAQLGILNGLGTKGCSLAPYLAAAWKDQLLYGKSFDQEITLGNNR